MTSMTDQEFLAATPQEQIEYAAGIGRADPDNMPAAELAAWVDLHGKVRQLDPDERKAFLAGLAWETKQQDRERGSLA